MDSSERWSTFGETASQYSSIAQTSAHSATFATETSSGLQSESTLETSSTAAELTTSEKQADDPEKSSWQSTTISETSTVLQRTSSAQSLSAELFPTTAKINLATPSDFKQLEFIRKSSVLSFLIRARQFGVIEFESIRFSEGHLNETVR